MNQREFAMTLLRGQHLKYTIAFAGAMFAVLVSCACTGKPETKTEMSLETESPTTVAKPSTSEPPIPTGPLIDEARCEKVCEVMRCEERKRRAKSAKTWGDSPTPAKLEKLSSITPSDHPDRPDILFNLAESYFQWSRYRRYLSCEQQKQCVALGGQGAPLSNQNTCWAKVAKDSNISDLYLTKALETYRQVLEFPDFRGRDNALFYASLVHDELGDHDQAHSLRNELVETFPNSRYVPVIVRDYTH